jgi:hypothetical protein
MDKAALSPMRPCPSVASGFGRLHLSLLSLRTGSRFYGSERSWSPLMETVPLGTRGAVHNALRCGISVTAAEGSQTCLLVHARRRC